MSRSARGTWRATQTPWCTKPSATFRSAFRAVTPSKLGVHFVSYLQPALRFVVEILQAADLHAMRDAVLLGESSGIDQALRSLRALQRKAQIDSRTRRGLH